MGSCMNYIWGIMIVVGVVYGTITGNIDAVSDAVLSSAQEAVTLCITMLGVMGLWMGLMEIAGDSGLIETISRKIQPLIHFLFPGIPKDHPANKHITMNCVANFLGLGWAATPAGLKAMESLAELEKERRSGAKTSMNLNTASNEMCTFLILNISSLQLIPVNVIAYRSQYGSVSPTAIVVPGIIATAVSTAVAVVFCKVMDRKRRA
ncbi:MAG: nucleoside recognition protein [Lachnospiraceae bacterium]|nr:nucleoside recognition protein [Lachnospiraceae bacterium]